MDIPSSETLKSECPLESNCNWTFLYHSSYQNYNLPIYQCKTCGLQAQYPRPTSLTDLYGEDYYSGKAEFSYQDERKTEKFHAFVWDARIRNIQKFSPNGRFLDIGSSFGGLLLRAQKFGFETYGIEVSPYSSKIARDRGLEIFQGNFLDSCFPSGFFSVITMVEVIEHLENPKAVFQEVHRILRPGQVVVVVCTLVACLPAFKIGGLQYQ